MGKAKTTSKFKLVFTVALKPELPLEWLASKKIRVCAQKALESGVLNAANEKDFCTGVLIVITGVGFDDSRKSAIWIKENLDPDHVVNIGTAGATNSKNKIGDLIQPTRVIIEGRRQEKEGRRQEKEGRRQEKEGRSIEIDSKLPIVLPDHLPDYTGGSLESCDDFYEGGESTAELIDMEAFVQAEEFEKPDSSTSFHVLKIVSDHCNNESVKSFNDSLVVAQEKIKEVFSFLDLKPTVSVIIPVRNRSNWIGNCIESVLNQSSPPEEVIVVDDGSNDETKQAISKYSDKVKIITLETRGGVSCARNVAVKEAVGKWLCFLDSDDLWQKKKLENQISYLKNHPYLQILQTEEIWIRDGVRVNPHKHHKKVDGWIFAPSLDRCMITPSSVMMSKELFDRYGGFDESLEVCEDYDLWLRVSRNHVVGLDPSDTVIKHGGHADQLSSAYPVMDRFRVFSLVKALSVETDEMHKKLLKDSIKARLKILRSGSIKRNKSEAVEQYDKLLRDLDAPVEKLSESLSEELWKPEFCR